MIKIRRKKKLFEDGPAPAPTTGTTGQTPAPGTTPAPTNGLTPAPANGQTPAPTNGLTPAPANEQTPAPANGQQDQNAQLLPNPNLEKVSKFIQDLLTNTYWVMTVNLPEEIQKAIPDFKQGNQLADPAIKCWNDFKANPSKDTWSTFLNAFAAFGGVQIQGGDQNGQQGNGQEQKLEVTPANASTANASTNVSASAKAAYSFRKNLLENLEIAKKRNYYNRVCSDYFDKNEFTL